MANFYDDNADLQFYVDRAIDWEPIVGLTEYDWKAKDGFRSLDEAVSFYKEVLGLVGGFVADQVAPHVAELDQNAPKLVGGQVQHAERFDQIFQAIRNLELHGLCVPRELGGLNAPLLVFMLSTEIFARADVSVAAHHGFHGGMAMAALMYSVLEGTTEATPGFEAMKNTRFEQAIREIVAGEAWGSMDITEPDAGSDMAKLRCKGEQDADGRWFVTGEKIFITSGHGKWHFVIARTEEAKGDDAFAGLEGLSMFLVPAWEDRDGKRVQLAHFEKLEEKLGHHASATVAIRYDRSPAELIGKRGDGFKYMLLLMNNARVGVGFEALGLCEAAWRKAQDYAAIRKSMGKTIDQHEMIADYLEEMRTRIQAIRCLAVHACWHEEIAQKINVRLLLAPPAAEADRKALEKRRDKHKHRARQLTPLLKYTAAETAVQIARTTIQIHGGFGYIAEYGVEKLLRDAMVFPIYEGTSQIQALMAMKDNLMEIVKRPQAFVKRQAEARWRSLSARNPLERRIARLQLLRDQTLQFLLTRLAAAKFRDLRGVPVGRWQEELQKLDPKKDFALAMLHAERLCKILADVAIAEELWVQASRFPEREELLDRWLEKAEPRCRFHHDEITTTGERLLQILATKGHAGATTP